MLVSNWNLQQMVPHADTDLQHPLMAFLVTLVRWLGYDPMYRPVALLWFVLFCTLCLSHVASGFIRKLLSLWLRAA